MKNSTITIWLIVVIGLFTFVNFYMSCYNQHQFNEYVEKQEEVIKTLPPRVIQIDVNYEYLSDSSLIQVERKK